MSTFPLLLAGPIVRRVDPDLASVWMALSEACEVELSIWEGEVTSTSDAGQLLATSQSIFATGSRVDSIRLGEKLHVALATWTGSGTTLKHGALYSYNIKIKRKSDGQEFDLSSLRLLKDDAAARPAVLGLGYADKRLPAFVTPPDDLIKLKIAHGSCRKTFGGGEDAMSFLDDVIKDNRTAIDKRPQQLFLTGDQIYADEVAEMLLPALNTVGQELIGQNAGKPRESLAVRVPDEARILWPADLQHFPAARRQDLVQRAAAFTSSEANSHLMSLGEFYAMYLFAWSNVLWPETFTSETDLYADPGSSVPPTHKLLTPLSSLTGLRSQYAARKREIERYKSALPKVRRVLANVATYMIMDDHEVTDDWYLTGEWRRKVLVTPLGRYIICNALTAFGIFQGWGNDPKAFQQGKGQEFLAKVPLLFPSGEDGPVDSVQGALQNLYGMVENPLASPADYIKWYYTASGPEHDVIVLDTRNWRGSRSLYSPPALIDKTILEQQIARTDRAQGKEVTFVVSPAPVLGLPTIEEVLQPAFTLQLDISRSITGKGSGAADKDPEAWSFDPYAMEDFFARLGGHERVIFLSGDVHFGFSAELNYWRKGTGEALQSKARFIQLTASACKNVEESLVSLASSRAAQQVFEQLEAPVERLVWDAREPAPVAAPAGERLPAQYRNRFKESPVLVESEGWPEGTTVSRTPDRAWRFRMGRDARPDSSRPAAIRHLVLQSDFDPAGDVAEGYGRMLARHQLALRRTDPRTVLFDSNVGVAGFERGASLKLTEQSLNQLESAGGFDEATLDKLRQLLERDILEENFRAVLKAHLGSLTILTTQQLDTIKGKAVRTDSVLAVRHQLYTTHPEAPGKPDIFMQQLLSLQLTSEPAPAIKG